MAVGKSPRQNGGRPSIFLLEDEALVSMMLHEALRESGFDCVVAASVPDALAIVAEQSFGAAVIDLNVRGENSLGVVELLSDRGVPCIIASGYMPEILPPRFAELPFFQKPYDALEVIAAIEDRVRATGERV